jgi:hypothetical protein
VSAGTPLSAPRREPLHVAAIEQPLPSPHQNGDPQLFAISKAANVGRGARDDRRRFSRRDQLLRLMHHELATRLPRVHEWVNFSSVKWARARSLSWSRILSLGG